MKTMLTFALLTSTAIAAQCPSIDKVLINDQWQTPKGWQNLPLSPLANDTGAHTFTIKGLTHVFYLSSEKVLRCTYNKPGNNVKEDTYVIKQTVNNFHASQGNWQSIMNNSVYSCSAKSQDGKMHALDPKDCQWS